MVLGHLALTTDELFDPFFTPLKLPLGTQTCLAVCLAIMRQDEKSASPSSNSGTT